MWTLFVLDFDGTYNNEYKEGYGARPEVYQIPLDRQREVRVLPEKQLESLIHVQMYVNLLEIFLRDCSKRMELNSTMLDI